MPGKPRERLLIVAVLVCFGLLAVDQLVAEPLRRLWTARAGRIVELRRSVDRGSQLLDREQTLEQRWREMRGRSLPRQTAMTETQVFNAVNNWAQAARLSVGSLKPRWILDEDDCRKLEVRLSAGGDLSAIAHFLHALEVDSQPYKIEDVDLTSRDDQGRQMTLDLRFTGLVIEEKTQ
jgi:hypothetical protein